MAIPYGTSIVLLQDILSRLDAITVVQSYQLIEDYLKLDNSDSDAGARPVPIEVQKLNSFADIFATKFSFAPQRA
jgi:hypothetical protein